MSEPKINFEVCTHETCLIKEPHALVWVNRSHSPPCYSRGRALSWVQSELHAGRVRDPYAAYAKAEIASHSALPMTWTRQDHELSAALASDLAEGGFTAMLAGLPSRGDVRTIQLDSVATPMPELAEAPDNIRIHAAPPFIRGYHFLLIWRRDKFVYIMPGVHSPAEAYLLASTWAEEHGYGGQGAHLLGQQAARVVQHMQVGSH